MKRRTIGHIVKDCSKWLANEPSALTLAAKRLRPAKHDAMEKALFLWFTSARAKNLPISKDVLRNKAKQFGRDLGVDESSFHYSQGWIQRFKTRYNISSQKLSCESAGVDPATVLDGTEKAREVIKNFARHNVFNMDETGLFYQMLPDRSLTTS